MMLYWSKCHILSLFHSTAIIAQQNSAPNDFRDWMSCSRTHPGPHVLSLSFLTEQRHSSAKMSNYTDCTYSLWFPDTVSVTILEPIPNVTTAYKKPNFLWLFKFTHPRRSQYFLTAVGRTKSRWPVMALTNENTEWMVDLQDFNTNSYILDLNDFTIYSPVHLWTLMVKINLEKVDLEFLEGWQLGLL